MCHRSADRNIKHFTGENCRRSDRSTDAAGSRSIYRRIHIVRAPCAEITDRTASCRLHDTSCLCRDQRLMIHLQQNRRFHQLGIDKGRNYRNNRLAGIHDRPLAESINISLKAKVGKIFQKFFSKHALFTQITDVFS